MQSDQSTQHKGKPGKSLMIAAVASVITLASAGSVFVAHKSEAGSDKKAKAESAATATGGVENVAPAASGDAKAPAAAAGEAGSIEMGDPVVGQIGDTKIMRSDVFNYIGTLPEQIRQMPLQTLFPLALDQVVNDRIIGMKANQAKLESDPEVAKLFEQARGQIMRNVYVERELNKAVSQKDLLKAYEKMLEGFQRVDEVHARHILVKDEAKARELITKLDGGTDFKDLVKESTDPTAAQNGGDLGFFSKDMMVPEFADAAFAIEPGKHSKEPVKTQFGWHVIQIDEKRQRPEPQFEAVKPQLEAQIRRERLNEMLQKWQKEASIKKFDINGKPVKDEPAKKN
ncbi:MAG: peptidylprolyl isomerase [Micavibrio aeruginosavorus]|nr:peptidylprolyl isomerase [Micavibrio aeruginosavorus]